MPTIGRADIDVHYDGKGLPREARQLGEEAGKEAGEGYAEEFNDSARDGLLEGAKERREELRKAAETDGEESGKKYGTSFSDARDKILITRANKAAATIADIFSSEEGFEDFRKNIQKQTGVLLDVDKTAREVDKHLDEMFGNKQLDETTYTKLRQDLVDIAEKSRELDEIKFEKLEEEAHKANKAFDDAALAVERDRDALERNKEIRKELKKLLEDMNGDLADENRLMKDGDTRHRDLAKAMEALDGAALRLNPRLAEHHELLKKIDDVAKNGGTEEHYRGLTREANKLADTLEGKAKNIPNRLLAIGDGAKRGGDDSDKGAKGFGNLFRAFSQFDPGDNLGQLILVIIAVAGPAAVLASALAAQLTILAASATAAGVGVGILVAASVGLSGKFGPISADAQDAAGALKELLDPLKDLGREATNSTFGGLADDFRKLGEALPKLSPGVKAIGKALNGFIGELTNGISDNIGPINKLLEGFAPIIRNIGGALVKLLGAVGGVFKAAMPFAEKFTGDLETTIGKWSDWVNSIKGQKALQQWFTDAQTVMGQVGDMLGQYGKAFKSLITPETTKDLESILESLGGMAQPIADISVALSPLLTAAVDAVGEILKFAGKLTPVVEGIGKLVQGVVDFLSPYLEFIGDVLEPAVTITGALFDVIGKILSSVGKVIGGVFDGLKEAFAPIKKLIDDLVNTIKNNYLHALEIVQPAIDAFNGTMKALGKAVGTLVGHFIDAGKNALGFKDDADPVRAFLDGPFKNAVGNVTRFFKDLESAITNQVIPAIEGMDWAKIQDGLEDILDAGPDAIKGIVKIGEAIFDLGQVGGGVGRVVGSIAEAIAAIARGDYVGAAVAVAGIGEGLKTAGEGVKNLGEDVDGAGRAFQTAQGKINEGAEKIKSGMEANLNPAATSVGNLQRKIDELKSKQVQITEEGSDPSGRKVADLQEEIDKLTGKQIAITQKGAEESGNKVDILKGKINILSGKLVKVLEDGADPSSARVQDLHDRIDALKEKTVEVKENGAQASDKRVENLTDRITALKAKEVKVLEDGADPSSKRVKTLKDKIDDLTGKLVKVATTGTQESRNDVQGLKQDIDLLKDKTISVTTLTKAGKFAQGGIVAGGTPILGGKMTAFANGGILNKPTRWGNVLAGEAGLEALVPLTGPLSQVHSSVRELSAYARGMSVPSAAPGTSKTVAVQQGAIVVQTANANGAQVASSVLDRLALAVS